MDNLLLRNSRRGDSEESHPTPSKLQRNESKRDFNQKKNRYNKNCQKPYLVFVTHNNNGKNEDKEHIGELHPMALGKILRGNDSSIKTINRKGKNLIQIVYDNFQDANKFVNRQNAFLPTNWNAFIPDFKVSRASIGRNIYTDLTDEEIIEGIENNNTAIKVINVERFTRKEEVNGKIKKTPLGTVKFTFERQRIPR